MQDRIISYIHSQGKAYWGLLICEIDMEDRSHILVGGRLAGFVRVPLVGLADPDQRAKVPLLSSTYDCLSSAASGQPELIWRMAADELTMAADDHKDGEATGIVMEAPQKGTIVLRGDPSVWYAAAMLALEVITFRASYHVDIRQKLVNARDNGALLKCVASLARDLSISNVQLDGKHPVGDIRREHSRPPSSHGKGKGVEGVEEEVTMAG